jgi:hypothetical protein
MRIFQALTCIAAAAACCSATLADHCGLQYNFSLGSPGPAVADSFTSNYVSMFRDSDVGSPGTRKLFVGGSFDTIGGVAGTSGIATWDGSAFAPVGAGLYLIDMVGGQPFYSTPQVNAAIEFQGNLYIGGQFDGTNTGVVSRGVIRWTGTAYESVNLKDVDVGSYVVNAFAIYKGDLYAGGNFQTLGSAPSAPCIARYIPATNDWVAVAGSAPTTGGTNVFDLQVYNDGSGEKLYACGNFAQMGGMGSTTKHIAAFDGTSWANVGGGYSSSGATAYPRDFVVFDDGAGPALYAAGGLGLTSGNTSFSAVNRWNGKSWKPMAGFLDNPSVTSATVRSIGLYNDGTGTTMLADVRFFGSVPGGFARMVRFENFRFNEITPSALGDASSGNSAILEMFQYDDGSGSKLYIGGTFTSINGTPANHIATITGCTPVGNPCPADFNGGGLSVQDIFDFLNAWFAGCP